MSYNEGTQVGNAFAGFGRDMMNIRRMANEQADRETKLKDTADYNKSIQLIQSGDVEAIKKYRANPSFNHGQFLKAQGDVATTLSQQATVKQQKFQTTKMEIDDSREKLLAIGQQGLLMWDQNPRAAEDTLLSGWDLINSGDSMKYSTDRTQVIVTDNRTGKEINRIPAPTRESYTELYSKVATPEFDISHVRNKAKIAEENRNAYRNSVPWVNPETSEVIREIQTVNQSTGKYEPQYEKTDGTRISRKELQSGGFMPEAGARAWIARKRLEKTPGEKELADINLKLKRKELETKKAGKTAAEKEAADIELKTKRIDLEKKGIELAKSKRPKEPEKLTPKIKEELLFALADYEAGDVSSKQLSEDLAKNYGYKIVPKTQETEPGWFAKFFGKTKGDVETTYVLEPITGTKIGTEAKPAPFTREEILAELKRRKSLKSRTQGK